MPLALQGIDFERQIATFADPGSSSLQLEASYDLLIGADGASSTVRDILQVIHMCHFPNN